MSDLHAALQINPQVSRKQADIDGCDNPKASTRKTGRACAERKRPMNIVMRAQTMGLRRQIITEGRGKFVGGERCVVAGS